MKYKDGTFFKTCPERLREKVMYNHHTGREYVAYYPKGYDVIEYFNSGSQVNVSTVMQRKTGKIMLLKNEDQHYTSTRGAIKREMQVSHLIEKCMKPSHAPNVPKVIEGAYLCQDPVRSYLIEEQIAGYQLTLGLFNDLSRNKQKFVLTELAKNLGKMHFWIPDRCLKLSGFVIDTGGFYPPPLPEYRKHEQLQPILDSKKLSLVHNDLAPANILYDGTTLSILDYGRACVSSRSLDLVKIQQNYSDEFAARFLNAYIRVCEPYKARW